MHLFKINHFGADLSYVNQILDHGGDFKMDGASKNPYKIFKDGLNSETAELYVHIFTILIQH